MKSTPFLTLASLLALSLVAGCSQPASDVSKDVEGDKPVVKKEAAPQTATQQGEVQMATISVDGAFSPAETKVKKGQPVELTFDTKNRACAETVVFKGMDLKTELTDGKKTVVKFTPKDAGTIEYACGMDMMKGKIVVE